jgi:hypothetical protein
MHREALALQSQLARQFSEDPDLQSSLADTLVNLADLCNERRQFDQARAFLQETHAHH